MPENAAELERIKAHLAPCDTNRPYIFISYSRKDRSVVWPDAACFQRHGYNVWLDTNDVDEIDDTWWVSAQRALEDMDCALVLFYFSPFSLTSANCKREMDHTASRLVKKRHLGKPLPWIAVEAEPVEADVNTYVEKLDAKIRTMPLDKSEKTLMIDTLSDFRRFFVHGKGKSADEKIRIRCKSAHPQEKQYYQQIFQCFGRAGLRPEKDPAETADSGAQDTACRLLDNLPECRAIFEGREDKLEEIAQAFASGSRVVYLTGMGGIGKSELAKQFARLHRDQFHTAVFLPYAGSLLALVCDPGSLEITGLERYASETDEAFFTRKMKALRQIAGPDTLLIIDNFDVDTDERLKAFLDGEFRVLLTTRNYHEDGKTVQITPISDPNALLRIFARNYDKNSDESMFDAEEKTALLALFAQFCNNTYMIELAAKLMFNSGLSVPELPRVFSGGNLQADAPEKVSGRDGSKTLMDHICVLFSFSRLNDAEKQILRLLSLLGNQGIDAAIFKNWAELKTLDTVTRLGESSWIRREARLEHGRRRTVLSLHPLIREAVRAMLKTDAGSCAGFLLRMAQFAYVAWKKDYGEKAAVSSCISETLQFFSKPAFDLRYWYVFDALGTYLWQIAKFDESNACLLQLYGECLQTFGEASEITGYVAKSVAASYFNRNDVQASIPWYKQSLRCMQLAGVTDGEDLAMCYEKVGRCYTWEYERDLGLAEKYMLRALAMREELLAKLLRGETVRLVSPLVSYTREEAYGWLGEIHMELGRLYQTMGDFPKALLYAEKYLRYLEQEAESSELVNASGFAYGYFDMGVCHYHIGLAARDSGDAAAAAESFTQALDCLQQALELNMKMRAELAFDTAANEECLGDVFQALDRPEDARNAYAHAVSILRKLTAGQDRQIDRIRAKTP